MAHGCAKKLRQRAMICAPTPDVGAVPSSLKQKRQGPGSARSFPLRANVAVRLIDAYFCPEPFAAFSNSFRCARNSVSFALTPDERAGRGARGPHRSGGARRRSGIVAPAVPRRGGPRFVGGLAPISAVRFASTFAYDAFHSVFVVISSLKLAMSCVSCVRGSPDSCCAAGSFVTSPSESRAAVSAGFAPSASGLGCAQPDPWALRRARERLRGCCGLRGGVGGVACVGGGRPCGTPRVAGSAGCVRRRRRLCRRRRRRGRRCCWLRSRRGGGR